MPRFQFPLKIKKAIIDGIRDCGEVIFMDSQSVVPVDKGTLKKSGRVRKIAGGIQINYRAPYAAAVEYGFPAHSELVRQHYVRAHYRKFTHKYVIVNVKTGRRITHVLGPVVIKNGIPTRKILPVHIKRRMKNKVFVRAHMRGPFTRDDVSGRVGAFYLRSAVDNHLPDLVRFIENRLASMP